jgi:hypothetical protein
VTRMGLPGQLQRALGRVGSALPSRLDDTDPIRPTLGARFGQTADDLVILDRQPDKPNPDRAYGVDRATHAAIAAQASNACLFLMFWHAASIVRVGQQWQALAMVSISALTSLSQDN